MALNPPTYLDMKLGEIRGSHSTHATIMVWDEAEFDYVLLHDMVGHKDVRDLYLALHQPPMVIVKSIRYGNEKPIYPGRL